MFKCMFHIDQSLDLILGIVNGRTFISDFPHSQLKALEKVKLLLTVKVLQFVLLHQS
jgi:hypothetical protein